MKILDKIAFVVFALASVAGCSVDVLPSEDGGTVDDDQNDADVTPDDDTDPTEDGGGNPDDVDDDVTPDDDMGEDGGQLEEDGGDAGGPDGGPVTVPVDRNGNVYLGDDCDPDQIVRQEMYIELWVWRDDSVGSQLELQWTGDPHLYRGYPIVQPGNPENYGWVILTFDRDPEWIPPDQTEGFIRLLNSSDETVRISSLKVFGDRDEQFRLQNLLWEQVGGYPEIGPGRMIDLAMNARRGENYEFSPHCIVHLEEIP